jgi:protocatechuate 3,4-dioxygenase beta subunit
MNSYRANGRTFSVSYSNRRRWGGAKPAIIIGLIVFLAVAVPLGVYIVANIAFPNGTTGASLSVPDTGVTIAVPKVAANAVNNGPVANRKRAVNVRPPGKMMDLLVVDQETKQPISGIRVQSYGVDRFSGNTGADGRVRVPAPAGPVTNQFTMRISGKGYVPQRMEWASYRPELGGEVPAGVTVEMGNSTKVSGKIVDDSGQPVAGAHVYLEFNKKFPSAHEQIDLSPYDQNRQIRSGEDGSWSFNGAPVNCEEIGLTAWDYKHVTGDYWSPQPFSPASKLYDGTAVFTLHRGITVDGIVLDPQGAPVVGAAVALGQQRGSSNAIPALNTDSAGHFAYQFDPGQQVILTVQAKGFAPELRQFTMGQQTQNLSIPLSKPHRISGKIVDPNGKPVRNVSIYFNSWRGLRTIEANFQTDGSGNFHWNDAPADPVTVRVDARNWRGVDEQTLTPDVENVIKLHSSAQVRGTVTDMQTGKPIDNYHVTFGILWKGQETVTWQGGWNPGMNMLADGKFEFTDNFSYPGIAVRIERPGYLPAESRVVKLDDGDTALDFKLKPAKDIVLTIHGPDGKPVEGVTAVVALAGWQVSILNGRTVQFSNLPPETSAADGRVEFSPQAGPYTVVIFGDAGSAEVNRSDVEKSADVTLKPWGHIEGRVMVGSKPAAEQDLDVMESRSGVYDPNSPRIFYQVATKTDDNGRFLVDRVSSGSWSISRRINSGPNSWTSYTLSTVEVSAGKTISVNVGGMGRPVVGKVVIPPELASRTDWSFGFSQMYTQRNNAFPSVPIPDDIKKASREKQQEWYQNWQKTDAGKAMIAVIQKANAGQRNYAFSVAADGTFRVEDVVAGTYEVSVRLRSNNTPNGMGDAVGLGSARLVVPEMPGGRSDEPLQMDPIAIMKLGKYQVGDVAYDLPMKSFDRKDLKLSDFRGKYVLLAFRIGPSDSGALALSPVYLKYGHDNRLAMLTVGMSTGLGRASKRPDISWQQAEMIPDAVNYSILGADFGIDNNSPGAWLIGPDGKVVAGDLRDKAVLSAVTAALGPAVAEPTTTP